MQPIRFGKHIETFLHVRFVASEYSTGKTHSGRIDTLGIDENFCPTIIEYKRKALALSVHRPKPAGLEWYSVVPARHPCSDCGRESIVYNSTDRCCWCQQRWVHAFMREFASENNSFFRLPE